MVGQLEYIQGVVRIEPIGLFASDVDNEQSAKGL